MTLKEVIKNTADYLQETYKEMLQEQLSGDKGSVYLDVKDPKQLDMLLRTSDWEETIHPAVAPGCRVFVTHDIPGGHAGLVDIADLPDDAKLFLKTDIETHKNYVAVENDIGPSSRETWVVIAPNEIQGGYILQSIHPGEIGQPTMREIERPLTREEFIDLNDRRVSNHQEPLGLLPAKDDMPLTKTAAIAMGYDKARISLPEQMKEFVRDMQRHVGSLQQLNEELRSPEICKAAVERNGMDIRYVPIQTQELCLAAVRQNPWALQYVENKTQKINLEAVRKHGSALYFIEAQTPECCAEAVSRYGSALEYVKDQTPEICMKAVRSDGLALKFVKEQTPEICLAAVRQIGGALEFVREQTPQICMEAVQSDGRALEYVKDQTPELCLAALREDPSAIEYIEEPTPEMLAVAERDIPEPQIYEKIAAEEPSQEALDLMDEMNRAEFDLDGPEFTEIGIERFNDIGDVVRVTEDISEGLGNPQNDEPDPFDR